MIELFGDPPASDAVQWWPIVEACLVFAACLIGSVMATVAGHEIGHLILGRLAGYRFSRLSFGSGRNLASFRIGDMLVELNLGILDGQAQPNHAEHPDSGLCQNLLSLGGVLANAAMMSAALLAWHLADMPTWARVALGAFVLCNAAYMLLSLAPYTARDDDGQYYEMDAYQVIRTWRVGPRRADQDDYMTLVSPYFTDEFERPPSRSARDLVEHVKALRTAAWRAGADAEAHKASLQKLLERGRLTKPEARLVQDALRPQPGEAEP